MQVLWLWSVVSCTCITAGGSRYRPSGGGGGMGMRPSGIGGGADPLTGTALYMFAYCSGHIYTHKCTRTYTHTHTRRDTDDSVADYASVLPV